MAKKPKKSKAKGPKRVPEMERRRRAVQATAEKFGGVPFAWGSHDCAAMVSFHLAKAGHPLGDHKAAGSYSTAIGAQRAIKRIGFDNLSDLLDARFPRIPAAFARLGDLVAFEADHPVGAIGIHLGNASVMVYSEEDETGPIQARIVKAEAAWRIG